MMLQKILRKSSKTVKMLEEEQCFQSLSLLKYSSH